MVFSFVLGSANIKSLDLQYADWIFQRIDVDFLEIM